jgi:hypothetical protein
MTEAEIEEEGGDEDPLIPLKVNFSTAQDMMDIPSKSESGTHSKP